MADNLTNDEYKEAVTDYERELTEGYHKDFTDSSRRGPAADYRRISRGMVPRSVRLGKLSPRTCKRQ